MPWSRQPRDYTRKKINTDDEAEAWINEQAADESRMLDWVDHEGRCAAALIAEPEFLIESPSARRHTASCEERT